MGFLVHMDYWEKGNELLDGFFFPQFCLKFFRNYFLLNLSYHRNFCESFFLESRKLVILCLYSCWVMLYWHSVSYGVIFLNFQLVSFMRWNHDWVRGFDVCHTKLSEEGRALVYILLKIHTWLDVFILLAWFGLDLVCILSTLIFYPVHGLEWKFVWTTFFLNHLVSKFMFYAGSGPRRMIHKLTWMVLQNIWAISYTFKRFVGINYLHTLGWK